MFLRSTTRLKDGKKHYYWSIVENRRCRADRVVQQTVLYLGEINDSQREQWIRAIEVFDEDAGAVEQLKLFAAERRLLATAPDRVEVRLKDFELHRPRQWGGCWLSPRRRRFRALRMSGRVMTVPASSGQMARHKKRS